MFIKEGQSQLSFLYALLCVTMWGIYYAAFHPAPEFGFFFVFAVFAVVSIVSVWRKTKFAFLWILVLLFVFAIFRMEQVERLSAYDISHYAGAEKQISGVLREPPQSSEREDGLHVRYVIDLLEVRDPSGGNREVACGGAVLSVTVKEGGEKPQIRVGDRITVVGKIRIPHGYRNPGQMDRVRMLRAQNITAQIIAGKHEIKVCPEERSRFLRTMEDIRSWYRKNLEQAMSKADAAAIFAMLFGGYGGIREELLEAFAATGIIHILSVSGSHITLLAVVMAYLGKIMRLPRILTAVMVIASIFIYAALAGFVPPVIRSALMGTLAFCAVAFERERDGKYALALVGIVMLLYQPYLLFHVSFQLSFAATAGLLFLSPVLYRKLKEHIHPFFAAGFSVTLGAQLMALPLLVWYFHRVSIVSLLANVTAIPLLEFLIVLGLFAGIIGCIFSALMHILFIFGSLLLGLVYEWTRVLAKVPFAQVTLAGMGGIMSTMYYAILFIAFQDEEKRRMGGEWIQKFAKKKSLHLIAGVGILVLFGWSFSRPAEMEVHFIDVGQGEAAVVITPHGKALMFDTGGVRNFDIGKYVDVPYLLHYGVSAVDAIFLTHAHLDHAGGAGAVARSLPVNQIFTGKEGVNVYRKAMGISTYTSALPTISPAEEGRTYSWDGVKVEAVSVPEREEAATGNEYSVVYRVSYGKANFLFTGDLTAEQEAKILQEGAPVESTVLKVGHHGADTSTSAKFLQAVNPHWAVISVGADNPFGHPKQAVLDALEKEAIETYRTDRDGAIVFRTDGERMRVETFVRR